MGTRPPGATLPRACQNPGAQAHALHCRICTVLPDLLPLLICPFSKRFLMHVQIYPLPSAQQGRAARHHTWRPLPCSPHLPGTVAPCSGKANAAGDISQRTAHGGQHKASAAYVSLQTSESREFISCYIYHTISAVTRVKVQIAAASQTHWGWMEPISFKDEWEE